MLRGDGSLRCGFGCLLTGSVYHHEVRLSLLALTALLSGQIATSQSVFRLRPDNPKAVYVSVFTPRTQTGWRTQQALRPWRWRPLPESSQLLVIHFYRQPFTINEVKAMVNRARENNRRGVDKRRTPKQRSNREVNLSLSLVAM